MTDKKCSKCSKAQVLENGVIVCHAAEYDIDTLSCFSEQGSSDDVKPVVKGKWVVETIEDPNGNFDLWACDKCRCYQATRRRFCPDCGAEMPENDYD